MFPECTSSSIFVLLLAFVGVITSKFYFKMNASRFPFYQMAVDLWSNIIAMDCPFNFHTSRARLCSLYLLSQSCLETSVIMLDHGSTGKAQPIWDFMTRYMIYIMVLSQM